MGTAAKVLTGSSGRMIDRFGLRRLSTYGLLSEYTQLQVLDWIRELISKGCLVSRRTSMGKKSYPVLILTDRGYSVMSGKEAIRLSGAVKESKTQLPERLPLQTREMDAFERLRELRTLIAREERLPSYCIFHDRTLREMARNLPVTPGGLLGITGVGEVTMRKYGGRFLDLIQEIKGEN
jgi:ATP-dependent DNA helicase RecQ